MLRRYAVSHVAVVGLQRRCPRRVLWSAAECLRVNPTAARFAGKVKAEGAADPHWALDYPQLERLFQGAAAHAPAPGHPPMGTGGALSEVEATLSALPSYDVRELDVTLSSPDSYAAAAATVRRLGHGLRALRLRVDAPSSSAAVAEGRRGNTDALRGGGAADGRDPLAKVLMAVVTSKHLRAQDAAPLEEFELVSTDGDTQFPHNASGTLADALVKLLSSPWVALRSVGLHHLDGRLGGDEAAVARLAEAMRTKWSQHVASLDLRGSSLLLQHLLRARCLRSYTSLSRLDISDCALGDVWAPRLLEELAGGIGGWYCLTVFRASQCGFTAYAMELLLSQLRQRPHAAAAVPLTCLALSANRLGDDEAAGLLALCLVQCHALEEVDLRHSGLSGRSAEDLISALAHATGLRVLCLSANRLGEEGAAHLAMYSKCWPALAVLDLTRCHITGDRGVRSLATAIAHLESIAELYLTENALGAGGGTAAEGRAGEGTAERGLKLFAYDKGYLKADGESKKVPTSFELDRRDREMGRVRYRGPTIADGEAPSEERPSSDAYSALGEALSTCRALRVLDLTGCHITDAGFTALATRLAPAHLQQLRLAANPLFLGRDSTAVAALVRLLWCCTETLRVLDLGFTGLGDWGLVTLCDGPVERGDGGEEEGSSNAAGVMQELRRLQSLQLPHARIGAVGLEALTDAVAALTELRALVLDGNTVRDREDTGEGEGVDRCVALLGRLAGVGSRCSDGGSLPRSHPQLRLVSLGGCLSAGMRRSVIASPEARRLPLLDVQVIL